MDFATDQLELRDLCRESKASPAVGEEGGKKEEEREGVEGGRKERRWSEGRS